MGKREFNNNLKELEKITDTSICFSREFNFSKKYTKKI